MVDADPSGNSSPPIRPRQPRAVVGIKSEQVVGIMSEQVVAITPEWVVGIKSEWVVGSSRNPQAGREDDRARL
jgi:hypothetical protein